jgi:hypothetical protein
MTLGPTYRPSGGLLLAAVERGDIVPPTWAPVDLGGGLVVQVATDALRATLPDADTPLRLPASYRETIQICRSLGCVAPTARISDATWQSAGAKIQPRPLVFTAGDAMNMATVEWTLRHNASIESQLVRVDVPPGVIIADVGKDWIVDDGLSVRGAVNYGWRNVPGGHPLQSVGHMHDMGHWDFSQVVRPVRRWAALHGDAVDLLEVLADTVQARWLEPYR